MRVEKTKFCTLYLADCRDVLQTLTDVDAVITDPPYGISLANHNAGLSRTNKRGNHHISVRGDESHEVFEFIDQWCSHKKTCFVAFGTAFNPYPGKWRNVLVWNKGGAVGGGGDTATCFRRTHELIYMKNNGPLRNGRHESVINFPTHPVHFKLHPCQKPVGLMSYIIEQITDAGFTVVDPCMGSGSTGVACVQKGRRFIGIECDEGHFNSALNRIAEAEKSTTARFGE